MNTRLPNLEAFCQRWHIQELAVFGSVLRSDFGPDSDIDFLLDFGPNRDYSLETLLDMSEELSRLVGRPVDIVIKGVIEADGNPYRRAEILGNAQKVYCHG
jgi:predicted nucleotidyltransferase